jgi:hypothetical protein
MSTLYNRLRRCNHAIETAVAESKRLHTEAELAGILIWEMDERNLRELVLIEIATQGQTIWERL